MTQLMEQVKIGRLQHERMDKIIERQQALLPLLLAYRQNVDPHEIVPSNADIVRMPPFAAIIESDLENSLSAESFHEAMLQLPALCSQWQKRQNKLLHELLPASSSGPEPRLELATTLFQCGGCFHAIPYPRILAHKCMTDLEWLHKDPAFKYGSTLRRFRSLESLPFNHGGNWCSYDHKAANFAAGILQACGMDPETTTSTEMDEKQVMFADKCTHRLFRHHKQNYRYYMNWRMAVCGFIRFLGGPCYIAVLD